MSIDSACSDWLMDVKSTCSIEVKAVDQFLLYKSLVYNTLASGSLKTLIKTLSKQVVEHFRRKTNIQLRLVFRTPYNSLAFYNFFVFISQSS